MLLRRCLRVYACLFVSVCVFCCFEVFKALQTAACSRSFPMSLPYFVRRSVYAMRIACYDSLEHLCVCVYNVRSIHSSSMSNGDRIISTYQFTETLIQAKQKFDSVKAMCDTRYNSRMLCSVGSMTVFRTLWRFSTILPDYCCMLPNVQGAQ